MRAVARKRGSDLAVGDLLVFLSKPYMITNRRPIPDSPLVKNGTLPPDTFVAESTQPNGYVWGMTIIPSDFYQIISIGENT